MDDEKQIPEEAQHDDSLAAYQAELNAEKKKRDDERAAKAIHTEETKKARAGDILEA